MATLKLLLLQNLKKKPKNFQEYIQNEESQNYQCKFLIGRSLADLKAITQEDYENIIKSIETLNIHCGVTNEYQKKLDSFQAVSKIKLEKKTIQRKKTPNLYEIKINT
jgi:predicted flavoprotein YhiN